MAAELVHSATSEKLTDVNWGKNIKICEEVARNPRQAKDVIKQIKKRLGSKNSNTQLFSVMLLEMLMNNIGEHIHREVINVGLLPVLVKIVKKKSDSPIRERIFLLLDATQTSLGGASGKFPQYYTAYHDLVSAGVQFSQGPQAVPPNRSTPKANNDNPTSASVKSNDLTGAEIASSKHERDTHDAASEIISESSIIQKADNALEVLREVLDAAGAQNSEGAKDEFTLDLVEQCSFQKQRVMQLVLKSKDEKVVSRAIDLNEELQRVLARHDALLSGRPTLNTNNCNCEETEEDDEFGQILQSIIQKADHALEVLREVLDVAGTQNPEGAKDEFILDLVEQCSFQKQRVMQLVLKSKDEKVLSRAIDLNEELQRVLARHDALLSGRPTLITDNCNHEETEEDEEFGQLFRRIRKGKACATPEDEAHSMKHPVGLLESFSPGDRVRRPIIRPLCLDPSHESNPHPPAVTIPPPPAKHVEREKFFQDKKVDGGGSVAAHMRSLSLHSRDASSSHSSSFDSSD